MITEVPTWIIPRKTMPDKERQKQLLWVYILYSHFTEKGRMIMCTYMTKYPPTCPDHTESVLWQQFSEQVKPLLNLPKICCFCSCRRNLICLELIYLGCCLYTLIGCKYLWFTVVSCKIYSSSIPAVPVREYRCTCEYFTHQWCWRIIWAGEGLRSIRSTFIYTFIQTWSGWHAQYSYT